MVVNGDFSDGLTGWSVVSGNAFDGQPVPVESVNAAQVVVGGGPVIPLGGDYWHTDGFPLGNEGTTLLRVDTDQASGVLDSDPFDLSARYLAFRLGGSGEGSVSLELRVPLDTAQARARDPLDPPDGDGYVAILVALPNGSDMLAERVVDLVGDDPSRSLLGARAKVRLNVFAQNGRRRLVVDAVRLLDERPPPFRRPVWGWADIHCHPMAQAGFGGLMAGHIHGPVEDAGSCLEVHGHEHRNDLFPTGVALDGGRHNEGRHNDGGLASTGWSVTGTPGPEEQGFRGWPAFDELTHLKTHQDWIRRAYDGGLRLMVALVVHNQLLAAVAGGVPFGNAQGDRDAVEPQVRMLHEFVAHNGDWCGLATSPDQARDLIESNRLAFVLGLETDSINGWSGFGDLPNDDTPASRAAARAQLHDYFGYLRTLGIVQVNLLHLSDNAFGGMALYDVMFVVNTFTRTGRLLETEDGFLDEHGNERVPGEAISMPVSVASKLWSALEPLAATLNFTAQLPDALPYRHGHRNKIGLLPAGEEALLEAMRLGMVIDIDHMSEKATGQAFRIATSLPGASYPLVAAHNGARIMAMSPPPHEPGPGDPAIPGRRRNPHTWPNESTKSETQLGYIKDTGGMFGHGIAGVDSQSFGAVANDAPGTSKTVAQGLQYVMDKLEGAVGLGTDWNALLGGPGPRFGPMALPGLTEELEPDDEWARATREERWTKALLQNNGVTYDRPLRDWRAHRFRDSGLFPADTYGADGPFIWQALALDKAGVDLDDPDVVGALVSSGCAAALDLARGLRDRTGAAGSDYYQAGAKSRNAAYPVTGDGAHIDRLVQGIAEASASWDLMTTPGSAPLTRSTAGPMRDFDYNLDGLAHYGMLPDMLQDLRNVGLPMPTFGRFFASAECYLRVWERSEAAAVSVPPPDPVPDPGGEP